MTTIEQAIAERLQAAAQIVDRAQLSPELRSAAFVLAYEAVPSTNDPEPRGVGSGQIQATRANVAATRPSDELGDQIAGRLHVAPGLIERVVDIDDDGVHLIIQRRWLDPSKRPAMRQIALLTIALRQAAALEEWTPLGAVREECQRFGVYLSNHFSEDVKAINGLRIRGSGAAREAKATVATFEEAGELVTSLVPETPDGQSAGASDHA
jgi:hypothetical protein